MCSFKFSNTNTNTVYDNSILATIHINTPPYGIINYTNLGGSKSCLFSNTISYLNLKLTDQNNNIINLNGCDWNITLQIDIVDFVE